MTINIYSTHELTGVVRTLRPPQSFWLDLCFPRSKIFDTESIDFDDVIRGRRMAPFVAPHVSGKVMTEEGFTTKKFKPAYVKPKHVVDPTRTMTRMAGESIGGNMSPEERFMANVADLLNTQREMIWRRWEWMASQAAQFAAITVAGENYPTVTLDFGRSAALTKNLTGANRWDQGTAFPLDNLDAWQTELQRTSGYSATMLILGPNAWRTLYKRQDFRDLLDIRRATQTAFDISPGNGMPAQYKGTLGATLEVWVYSDIYEDDTGANVEMMNADDLLLLSPGGIEGVRCYGAIMDARNGYQPADIFQKMWEQEDPSVVYLMSQSAPLMVPMRPNASLRARVLNAA